MTAAKVALPEAFAAVTEHWRPRIVARLNGQDVKVARFQGPFVWHHHDDADELFLVWRGSFDMEFRDAVVHLEPGDLLVVPRGVEHRPNAAAEVEVLLFEPEGVRNTGNVEHPTLTAPPAGAR
jgi:mannose-6-phosphate isomerase-like protein (cupin superfamily)